MLATATATALDPWLVHELAAELVRDTVRALSGCASVMPLKGTLVARTCYASVAERPMRDCDVLVIGAPSMRAALRRLRDRGYEPLEWSKTARVVTLVPPAGGRLMLDVHFRPLPYGLGRVDTTWMMGGAARDEALFGVPVYLPAPSRLLAQLLGNVLKDHVHRAASHCAEDISRVLDHRDTDLSHYADAIFAARLRLGSFMVLEWVAQQAGSRRARVLQDRLRLTARQKQRARLRLASLGERSGEPTLAQRVFARTTGDTQSDRLRALCAAGLGACASALRNRTLRQGVQARAAVATIFARPARGKSSMSEQKRDPEPDAVIARRKLLKMVAYVAPAIVSTLAVRHAHAQINPSCAPAQCNPGGCPPSTGCGPNANCGPNTCRPAGR